jgi:hypothetical protein
MNETWNWIPCTTRPEVGRRILIWHRVRPYCRYHEAVVGWWNSEEWIIADNQFPRRRVYQPICWCEIETPALVTRKK